MSKFTNKKGEIIELSDKHLETAVRIKLELQNSSNSRRCSWSQLVGLMRKEGFSEAENSENYRCVVKYYQKSIGELPSLERHIDLVASKKIESIKEMVGEISYEKRNNQKVLQQLNKVKRDIIDNSLIADSIIDVMKDYDWRFLDIKEKKYIPKTDSNDVLLVNISDWHIGAIVDMDENKYNYSIAKERLEHYLEEIIKEIKNNNIKEVVVANLGDMIENPYMHSLAFSCEFTQSEQIVRASDLIVKFINRIREYSNVTYFGIAGNHDRMNADKNKNIDTDHAIRGVNAIVKMYIEGLSSTDKGYKATYEQANDYYYSKSINGLNIKFVHGDLDGINDLNLIAKHTYNDNITYDLVLMGHYHHHAIKEMGMAKFLITFGSLKGVDSFGKTHKLLSSSSQGMILIKENGSFQVKNVIFK